MSDVIYDLIIIGGGINGAGIALDAAGRDLSVLLIEQNDFASGTSCKSSKLIHGGIRYLENYEFGLVKKALKERKILSHMAPDLIQPLKFIIPNEPAIRSPIILRIGLWIYDLLSLGSKLPKSKKEIFTPEYGLKNQFKTGFSYYDCQTDDELLVRSNIALAQTMGATALNFTRCTKITHNLDQKLWQVYCTQTNKQTSDAQETYYQGKIIINATGPWLNQVHNELLPDIPIKPIALVKGSHIAVKKLYPQHHAFLLQSPEDGRVIFTLPYKDQLTLIGTTDISYSGDPALAEASEAEKVYLLNIVNQYFKQQLQLSDITEAWAGVRPLLAGEASNHDKTQIEGNEPSKYNKSAKLSRDYHIEIEPEAPLPLVNIYGGKITTYRKLSEQVVNLCAPLIGNNKTNWTHKARLNKLNSAADKH